MWKKCILNKISFNCVFAMVWQRSRRWFGWGLYAAKQQAIKWLNTDQVSWRHVVCLDLNKKPVHADHRVPSVNGVGQLNPTIICHQNNHTGIYEFSNHPHPQALPLFPSLVPITLCSRISHLCIDGLVQERRDSIANAPGLRLSCTNPSINCS